MYEIKVLSSDEFDRVSKSDPRYSYVDGSNLGFADRKKGKAYVRQTHIHELNKYLISHELEELEEDDSLHEDANGIRHKKGPKLFKDIILPILSGGAIQPEAPQREAAQTTNVPGVGNVLNSQLSMFQGGGQQSQSSGSYSPSSPFSSLSGAFSSGSPLSLFSTSGSYSPANVPSSVFGGGAGQPNISINELDPELKNRQSGYYSGRLTF